MSPSQETPTSIICYIAAIILLFLVCVLAMTPIEKEHQIKATTVFGLLIVFILFFLMFSFAMILTALVVLVGQNWSPFIFLLSAHE